MGKSKEKIAQVDFAPPHEFLKEKKPEQILLSKLTPDHAPKG